MRCILRERENYTCYSLRKYSNTCSNFLRSALQGDPTIATILVKFETNLKIYIALNTLQLLYLHLQIAFDRYNNNVRRVNRVRPCLALVPTDYQNVL